MRKRTLLKKWVIVAFVLITALNLNVVGAYAAPSTQMPIAGSAIPQFTQQLPTLSIAPQNSTIKTLFGNTSLTIRMCEFKANVLPVGTVVGYTGTWVWGYLVDPGTNTCDQLVDLYDDGVINNTAGPIDTSIGPVIVNYRGGSSTDIKWINDLGSAATTQVLAYKYSTDQTLHWADPLNVGCMMSLMGMPPMFGDVCAENYLGPVPAVVHLHGGEVPAEIDGSPDSWFTSDGRIIGHKYYSKDNLNVKNYAIYSYPNTQEAAPIWFHDHTLGATRLNVYAGMAGAYYIVDTNLNLPANLQPLAEVVPIAIQDRIFDTNGQLFFQTDSAGGILWTPNAEHPYWSPEFVGDTIIVNGKAWPYHNVQPKRYRFLFLNGSNARTYEMSLINQATGAMGPPMWVIATDGGYLDNPVKLDPALGQKLVMQPGERYEVIIDFTGIAGTNLIIRNTGRTPYPKGAPPQGSTLGRIMQFRVNATPVTDISYNPATDGAIRTNINQRIVRLPGTPGGPAIVTTGPNKNVQKIRELSLNEVMGMPMTVTDPVTGLLTAYPGGPLEILVNNTKWSGTSSRNYNDFRSITVNGVTTKFSELPKEGDTEVWEVVNLTADAHPIHLHLVQFQLINRQNFNVNNYTAAYNASFPAVPGDPVCIGGVFCPAFGPPLDYNTGNTRALGGNPDIAAVNKNGKPIYLQGNPQPPLSQEQGWKDTVIMYPGQVTRITVRWAPTDIPTNALASSLYYPFDPSGWDPLLGSYQFNYVWHCHIIDHEDNEMMHPDVVQVNPFAPLPSARPLLKGVDY